MEETMEQSDRPTTKPLTVGRVLRRAERALKTLGADGTVTGVSLFDDDRWVMIEATGGDSQGWEGLTRAISLALRDERIKVIVRFADGELTFDGGSVNFRLHGR
jgi:hypothetical protein